MRLLFLLMISVSISANNHGQPKFQGLVSSDIFSLDGGMNLYVEKRSTCNAGNTPKHFHPASGTLVYVLDGTSQSKSSGSWKEYVKNEYWFEKSDWVHGGEDDTPELPAGTCQELLVVRVAEKGKDHTVFIE